MTRINKTKMKARDGIIGPGPKPVPAPKAKTTKTKSLKRMNKVELANVALSRQINVEGMTKVKMLAALE